MCPLTFWFMPRFICVNFVIISKQFLHSGSNLKKRTIGNRYLNQTNSSHSPYEDSLLGSRIRSHATYVTQTTMYIDNVASVLRAGGRAGGRGTRAPHTKRKAHAMTRSLVCVCVCVCTCARAREKMAHTLTSYG